MNAAVCSAYTNCTGSCRYSQSHWVTSLEVFEMWHTFFPQHRNKWEVIHLWRKEKCGFRSRENSLWLLILISSWQAITHTVGIYTHWLPPEIHDRWLVLFGDTEMLWHTGRWARWSCSGWDFPRFGFCWICCDLVRQLRDVLFCAPAASDSVGRDVVTQHRRFIKPERFSILLHENSRFFPDVRAAAVLILCHLNPACCSTSPCSKPTTCKNSLSAQTFTICNFPCGHSFLLLAETFFFNNLVRGGHYRVSMLNYTVGIHTLQFSCMHQVPKV